MSRVHAQKPYHVFDTKESFAPTIPGLPVSPEALDLKSIAQGVAFVAPLVLGASEAMAKGGEYGILEGRSFAFVHPIVMGALFLTTAYTGYLGWQFRTIRTLAGEMSALKDSLPKLSDGSKVTLPVSKQIASVESALKNMGEGDEEAKQMKADLNLLRSPGVAVLDTQMAALSEKRKTLLAGDFRDRHYNTASTLLGLGVFTSILGGFNTFFRSGKLFPGPHLYAGAGITVLWAVAASMVPAMQKGNETARSLHIGLNALNLALFAWQVGTGLEIAIKVWGFTKWP